MPTKRTGPERCRRKFLSFFPRGFRDEKYVDWERGYKWAAHERWSEELSKSKLQSLIRAGDFAEVAKRAVTIESRTNLLFSFEKMALRDAVKPSRGAEGFATGLYDFLHGRGSVESRFENWIECVGTLPRKQTRVLTWPVVTVFGFIAQPGTHIFLKPMVTKAAADEYDFPFVYNSRPSWDTYNSVLEFGARVNHDTKDLGPRDLIDAQGFIWVQGSSEYD
jgi:hypothetical protein